MEQRLKKLATLLSLRERELHGEMRLLAQARAHERNAEEVEREANQAVTHAIERRRSLATRAAGAEDYLVADNWTETTLMRLRRAQLSHRRAKTETARSAARVMTAQNRVTQVETLIARVRAELDAELRRKERRLEDEITQNLTRRNR